MNYKEVTSKKINYPTSDFDTFTKVANECVKDFTKSNPIIEKLENGTFEMKDYHNLLVNLFHQVYYSSSSFGLADTMVDSRFYEIREYLMEHAEEEKEHWTWIINDLYALNSSVLKPIESRFDKEKLFLNDVNVIIRNNHSNEQFGVEMLTHKLFMSRSQLYRKIKALTNKSIAAYIRTIRLQDGMLQLKTTDKSITEIAYSVGFKNLTYFSSSFSQEFGCSPNSISRN